MNEKGLRELVGERFDDARNLVRHALQRSNDWIAIYGIAAVAEAYARRDDGIHLHLMLHPCPKPAVVNQRLAVYNIKNANALCGKRVNVTDLCIQMQRHTSLEFPASTHKSRKPNTTRDDCNNRDEAVLVGIVELFKKKKGVAPTPVPSLVWLKRVDPCPKPPIETLEESQSVLSVPERAVETTIAFPLTSPAPDATYREGSAVKGSRGRQKRELPNKAVECGTKVMGNLADQNTPLIGKGGRAALNAKAIVACLLIELGYGYTIGVSFEEPLKGYLQGYDLAVCPIDLRSWPIERMHEECSGQDGTHRQSVQ